jgi:hypothetical protein
MPMDMGTIVGREMKRVLEFITVALLEELDLVFGSHC